MDRADAQGAAVVIADEILSVLAGEIGYGEKAGGGVRADEHEDDSKRDEVAPIPDHAPRSTLLLCILEYQRTSHHAKRPRYGCGSRSAAPVQRRAPMCTPAGRSITGVSRRDYRG